MLKDFLTNNLVEVNGRADDWKDAIRKAGNLLIQEKKINKDYIEDIINATITMGAYFVVVPGIALAHSKPNGNVLQDCICMLHLEKGVEFGNLENDPVNIIIIFGSKNADAHLSILKDLTQMLSFENNLEKIKNISCKEELLKIIEVY